MRKPRTVAVVIPIYNAETTILEAVESVYQQSFSDVIIIAVDDGSTDGSLSKLNAIASSKSNIVVLTHTNHGAAYSRNRGIRYAQECGIQFVAFLDADDVWHEEKLAFQMKAFDQHPDADIVIVMHEEYDRIDTLAPAEFDRDRIGAFGDLFETMCLKDFVFHPASYVARLNLFTNECLYDSRFPCGEDYLPFLQFGYRNLHVYYIDVPLYFQRSLPSSLQRSRCAAYYGFRARVLAITEILSLNCLDARMTPRRISILLKAKDKYLSAMIFGARRCHPYWKALLTTIRAFGGYRNKRLFVIELVKTVLFPLTRSVRNQRTP